MQSEAFNILKGSNELAGPGEVAVDREDAQKSGFGHDHRNEGLEEIRLEVVERHNETHVSGRDHLSADAENESDAHEIQRTRRSQECHDRHDDGHMALRHAGQNADQEAQACDDDGSGKRSGLEAFDDLTQNACDVKQLDEKENAGDVAQQLPFDGADEDILDWNGAIGAHQHEDHGGGHHAHGDGCTDAAENHQKEDGRHGQNRKPKVQAIAL